VCANEAGGDAIGSAKVVTVGWVEWECWHRGTAVRIAAVRVHAADGEEGPSRWVARLWTDAIGRGLQKPDLVFWVAFCGAGQYYKELEEDATSEEDEGYQP